MNIKFINLPFSYVITWFNDITGSYIIALFLFALVIKLVMSPISIKQHKTQLRQAKLRPKEAAIRKKYAGRNDKTTQQKMQQEIQELYQKEGYSPLSGCLPLILQLVIMISLYAIIRQPLTYISRVDSTVIQNTFTALNDTFAAGIKNVQEEIAIISEIGKLVNQGRLAELTSIVPEMTSDLVASFPNFTVFGVIDIAATPSFEQPSWLLVIPALVFISQFISMKVTRKFTVVQVQQSGASNLIMDLTMPLMSVFFSFKFATAIGIYWIFQSVLAMAQSWILYKLMPPPVFTEEEYKAAERQLAGKSVRPAKRDSDADPDRPRPKSLHYIDDEDEEEAAASITAPTRYDREEIPSSESEEEVEDVFEEKAGGSEKTGKDAPVLKEDKNRHNYSYKKKTKK